MKLAELQALIGKSVNEALAEHTKAQGESSIAKAIKEGFFSIGKSEPELNKQEMFGSIMLSFLGARNSMCTPLEFAKKAYDGKYHNRIDYVEKAMSAGQADAGGLFIPEELADWVIELLLPATVVRANCPNVWPMPFGTLPVPKLGKGAVAQYTGENTDSEASALGSGQFTLTWKQLVALVPLSNTLLMFTQGRGAATADTIIRQNIVRMMAVAEDRAFLIGDGTDSTPRGLRNWALPGTPDEGGGIVASSGDDAYSFTTDLEELFRALESKNVPLSSPCFFMRPSTARYYGLLRDDLMIQFQFPSILGDKKLLDVKIATTNNIPGNLGMSGTETEVLLADMADAVIGDSNQIQIAVSDSAAYVNENGETVSAFSQNQTIFRAVARHDFGMQRAESIAVLTGVLH